MRGERAGDLAGGGAQPRQLAPAQRRVHARHRQRDDALQRVAPPRAAAAELRVEHGEQGHQRRHLQAGPCSAGAHAPVKWVGPCDQRRRDLTGQAHVWRARVALPARVVDAAAAPVALLMVTPCASTYGWRLGCIVSQCWD